MWDKRVGFNRICTWSEGGRHKNAPILILSLYFLKLITNLWSPWFVNTQICHIYLVLNF